MDIENLTCWVITEGMIGTENQCLAVTDALELKPKIFHIKLNEPWRTLTPWFGFEQDFTFRPKLEAPWPDLLITSGRKAVAAARFIKKKSDGKTFTLHLQDPKCAPSNFDLVAVPQHDTLRGENVIVTHGAPNRLTAKKLNSARDEFSSYFTPIDLPRIAVLIGGNSRTHKMTPAIMKNLVMQLKSLQGGLMITASRRTGDQNLKILSAGLADTDAYIWDGTGENPYQGMLAWADHILVTADSVSMISDAGTTGKPVNIIPMDGGSSRFTRFHNHMQDIGVARPFDGNLAAWPYEPLNDAQVVASAVKQAMQKRYG